MKAAIIRVQYITQGYWLILHDIVLKGKVIPAGTVTDFASIPKIMRSWVDPMDLPMPAVFHDDALQKLGEERIKNRSERFKAWREINAEMRRNMKIQGRHISKTKKAFVLFGVNVNAVVACFIFNKHPNRAKTLDDFPGFEIVEIDAQHTEGESNGDSEKSSDNRKSRSSRR